MIHRERSRQLELLSPARDADIGVEAVNHGADAVYIGGPGFGARASAGNPIEDIERLVRHAHRFGSKIFVTLNTILRDDELEPARRMAWQIYEAGVDALIIQDTAQLAISGRDEAITSNCHVQIAYAPNKLETAEWISKRLGQTTVITENLSWQWLFLINTPGWAQVQRTFLTLDELTRPQSFSMT